MSRAMSLEELLRTAWRIGDVKLIASLQSDVLRQRAAA